MDYHPKFRLQPSFSELTLRPSPGASGLALAYRRQGSAEVCLVKKPERVSEEARARVVQTGRDPGCWQPQLLSESELQFGQYRGQTFRWLLEHNAGYAAAILASHLKEREGGDTSQSPLVSNKDALASYAQLFPEMAAAIQRAGVREGSVSVRGMDETLVENTSTGPS